MLAEGFTQRKSQFLGYPGDILATETVDIVRLPPEHYSNPKLQDGKKILTKFVVLRFVIACFG
jgi:hypothetical protein